jgi:CheY-like chemotaxis protein
LAEAKPDLFLLDVSMPEMDGYTLCRRLKDDWDTQDIPVLSFRPATIVKPHGML